VKVGDLVFPHMRCAGQPGDVRCQTSIVVDIHHACLGSDDVKILCACNKTVWVPRDTLETISESR